MRIGIFSTVCVPWGGSEELWSQAASALLRRGCQVAVSFSRYAETAPRLVELQQAGADVALHPKCVGRRMLRRCRRIGWELDPKIRWIRRERLDFLLISVAHHMDDISAIAREARRLGIPYAVLIQSAGPYHWVPAKVYPSYREAYAGAVECYFVSEENRATLEMNMSLDFARGKIVDNPFNVAVDAAPSWPEPQGVHRLACVGRLDYLSKGQDLILRVLQQPKWRSRPLEVAFWGADTGSKRSMEDYIRLHGMQRQVRFGGFSHDIAKLWSEHHGLLLTSRYEGNPLALIEAMLCERMPVVTCIGRAGELVEDNVSGFLAAAPSIPLVDDALERAWAQRDRWREAGRLAAQRLRRIHSLQPAEDFARLLIEDAARHSRPAATSRAA